jgi:hypothetical protein
MTFSSSIGCCALLFLSLALGDIISEPNVDIGKAGDYAILTKAGISTVPQSVITGDIAVSPIAATAMTGFSLTADSTNMFSSSAQITGKAFAANYHPPIPTHLTTAVSNMEAAHTDAAGRANSNAARINVNNGNLPAPLPNGDDAPLTPGVYTFISSVTIEKDITFYGEGVYIIQMTGDLLAVPGTKVKLTGGAKAENIFWQIAGAVEVGEGAHMEGILLVKTNVLFKTGSSLNGRVLAQTRADLQMATITEK